MDIKEGSVRTPLLTILVHLQIYCFMTQGKRTAGQNHGEFHSLLVDDDMIWMAMGIREKYSILSLVDHIGGINALKTDREHSSVYYYYHTCKHPESSNGI